MYIEASYIALGSALMWAQINGYMQPLYYARKALTKTERNYNTTEREALGMIYAVGKFRHYLLGSTFVFHVDHQALVYIVNKAFLVGKMAKWMIILQDFDFFSNTHPDTQMLWDIFV